jgi:chromosome partitioning protein
MAVPPQSSADGGGRRERLGQTSNGPWVPSVYRRSVLAETPSKGSIEATPDNDPNCLAQLKHYRSLMPLAQEARKPMFLLTPADGALGGHFQAAQACRKEFRALASALAGRCSIPLP